MIDEKFSLLGALISAVGSLTYVRETIKGRTKPNRVTWVLWSVAPMIAFAAQLQKGVGWASVLTFMAGFLPFMILVSSFVNKEAFWKITKFDIFCGSISVLAIILWLVTGDGLLAIIFSILADFMAAMPTVVKSFAHPETEHPDAYRNAGIGAIITLLTIDVWKPENYAFAAYVLFITTLLYSLIRFKLGQKIIEKKLKQS